MRSQRWWWGVGLVVLATHGNIVFAQATSEPRAAARVVAVPAPPGDPLVDMLDCYGSDLIHPPPSVQARRLAEEPRVACASQSWPQGRQLACTLRQPLVSRQGLEITGFRFRHDPHAHRLSVRYQASAAEVQTILASGGWYGWDQAQAGARLPQQWRTERMNFVLRETATGRAELECALPIDQGADAGEPGAADSAITAQIFDDEGALPAIVRGRIQFDREPAPAMYICAVDLRGGGVCTATRRGQRHYRLRVNFTEGRYVVLAGFDAGVERVGALIDRQRCAGAACADTPLRVLDLASGQEVKDADLNLFLETAPAHWPPMPEGC